MKTGKTFRANRAAAGKRVRVNVRTLANMDAIKRETRNGRAVIVVPSATLPDNVVMNQIQYPADEIAKSFQSLNRSPAPAGHPMIGNAFVSARDPEGINATWIGAWNENVRRENGRVLLDKVIDVEVAGRSEAGRAVLNAIEQQDPIHTSTGLLCDLEPAQEGAAYSYIARNMEFDHDAILIGEAGAATPEQGVGMLVNAKGEQEEIEVVNSAIETADRELDWAVDHALQALQRRQRAPMVERIKAALADMLGSERDTPTTGKEDPMTVSKEQFDALSAEVKTLSESLNGLGETVTNAVTEAVKPLKEAQDKIEANQKAKDEAELSGLVAKIVKANIMDEDTAKELTLNAARKLAERAEPGKAAALNGAFGGAQDEDPFADYDPNAALDAGKPKEA